MPTCKVTLHVHHFLHNVVHCLYGLGSFIFFIENSCTARKRAYEPFITCMYLAWVFNDQKWEALVYRSHVCGNEKTLLLLEQEQQMSTVNDIRCTLWESSCTNYLDALVHYFLPCCSSTWVIPHNRPWPSWGACIPISLHCLLPTIKVHVQV